MGLVTIVLTVCLVSAPERCREESLQLDTQVSLTQCMFQSAMFVANWSQLHPALRVKKWRCKLPDVDRVI
ncbi:hypothetical protein [Sinorhizobium fredii]|uniref:Uncharacterized protein n=1 Tax=Rhizobium fredii TaxID=380 RepID=A0A2A6LR46_RHIFR|nr:hypothetical protein [Sinorhizobium fredii]PDT44686.1 hypothetical protein CO661_27635 [Sinorhizobium fredii]